MDNPGKPNQSNQQEVFFTALWVTLLVLGSVYFGLCFAVRGLVTADTCWLLALGRKMWESHQVPQSDPLSFTLPLAAAIGMPLPYVPHQWLAEMLFYASFLAGKL